MKPRPVVLTEREASLVLSNFVCGDSWLRGLNLDEDAVQRIDAAFCAEQWPEGDAASLVDYFAACITVHEGKRRGTK